jgi:outer membrane protein W
VRRAAASITLLLALVSAAPAAQAGGLDLRIGAFLPRQHDCGIPSNVPAEYTLFQDVCELYSKAGDGSFFNAGNPPFGGSVYGGVEYNHVIFKNVEAAVHFDGYSETTDTFYRDYERPGGGDIFQTLRLQVLPLGVSLRFLPTGKRHKFVPFVGGGIDAVFYKYEEFGDFIDFFDPDLAITPDHFISESTAFGVHALGGIRYYVNHDIAIVGEAKYLWAHDDMGDDFLPNSPGLVNRIDLSGWVFTGGVHLRF